MAEIDLQGLDELLKKLEDMGRKAGRIQNQALEKAAEPVLKSAKDKVHVDTGKLKDELSVGEVKTKKGNKVIEVGLTKSDNSEIFYGKFIEFGTSKMSARPYLQPALEENKAEIKLIIAEEIRKGLGLK